MESGGGFDGDFDGDLSCSSGALDDRCRFFVMMCSRIKYKILCVVVVVGNI